jgi:hypothetical protein
MSVISATYIISQSLPSLFDTGWELTQSSENSIVYRSTTNAYEEFRVIIEATKITVSVPMPNSEVLYTTVLDTPEEACDYIRNHIDHMRTHLEDSQMDDSDDE